MRRNKRYMNGQKRGGTPGRPTVTEGTSGRSPKEYHKQAVAYHGGDLAFEAYVKAGRKGYNVRASK